MVYSGAQVHDDDVVVRPETLERRQKPARLGMEQVRQSDIAGHAADETKPEVCVGDGVFYLAPFFKDDNGQLKKEFTEDGLHLNGRAYYMWYSIIRKYLP